MRTLLLAQGSSLATVDALPLEDAKSLYVTLQGGLWGPYGTAQAAYMAYLIAHANKETAIAIAAGKKYRATEPQPFHKMFPSIEDYMMLGDGETYRDEKAQHQIGIKALAALPGGAPAWLTEAAQAQRGK